MTDTKNTKEKKPTAEEVREAELEIADLLAGMPALRPPTALRMRHKNALKAIGLRHAGDMEALREVRENGREIDPELTISLMDMAAEMDEFAESIAFDKKAYEDWSIANSENIAVFVTLLNQYTDSLGE